MSSINHFDFDLLSNDFYKNIFLTANLTNDTLSSNKSDLNWPVLTLSILAVTGTVGNLLVCISISLDEQLQTVTNWFLFSLAIADCLLCIIVLPLAVIKDFQGKNKNLKMFFI